MRVYLAGVIKDPAVRKYASESYVLQSFYNLPTSVYSCLSKCKDLIVDSGAFSFMTSQKNKQVDFDSYAVKYAKFLKENNVSKYFELDIDSIVGIGKVEEIRRFIEKETGKPSIPVWHKSRGINYFKKMCHDYDYIAIGGIVSKEIKRKEYNKLIPLINYAHKTNTKIHGLGFTNTSILHKFKWDSVDSSSYASSIRFKNMPDFDPVKKKIVGYFPENKKIKDRNAIVEAAYLEWLKFQRYAEFNL